MGLYKDIALPLAARGIPTVPLGEKSKIACVKNWQNLATTDTGQIDVWDRQFPESNAGSVAKGVIGQFWYLEVDAPEVLQRIEAETGQKIPSTFRVRSSPGRGHFYWKQTPGSLAMSNITQPQVKNKDFSVRVDCEYVVSPGSWHPTSGRQYEIVSTADIIECPEWLIEWIISQKVSAVRKVVDIRGSDKFPRGTHDVSLTSIAGQFRSYGMEENALTHSLIEICEKRCIDYGDDYREMCAKIAASICKYPVPKLYTFRIDSPPPIEQHEPLQMATPAAKPVTATLSAPVAEDDDEEWEEQPTFTLQRHPKFPSWVMNGTSIYNGLVKPICDLNCRYEEFMFMPAMALLLNYVGTKIKVQGKGIIPSIYMVIIGKRGETMKSASVEDAINYFTFAGTAQHAGQSAKNAEGKTFVWTVGSPEGLGLEMQRTNCKNAVLYYDELSTLTNKAGIESSNLTSSLLGMYESAKFENIVKGKKEQYSLDPGTYCTTVICCCTDKNFLPNWGKLAGKSTGLDDRFMFIYQPERFKEPSPQSSVNYVLGAIETRKLIDKAINQGTYKIVDESPIAMKMKSKEIDNREHVRVVKFALGFAVDLDRREIDEDCLERALALIAYEKAVKKFLEPFEASTREGALQMELLTFLKRNNGEATMREINKSIHPEKLGTSFWSQSFAGLCKLGYIRQEGTGKKNHPHKVVLLRAPEEDDD